MQQRDNLDMPTNYETIKFQNINTLFIKPGTRRLALDWFPEVTFVPMSVYMCMYVSLSLRP